MPNRLPDPSGGIQPSTLTTTGDILYASSAQVAARLAIGSTNQALGVTGGVPAYQASSKSTLTTTGDIIYASAANTPARLGIGSSAQVLTVASGIPSWATASSGSMTLLTTTNLSGTTTSITGIDQTYKDLMLRIRGLTVTTGTFSLYVKVNASTTNCDGIDFNGTLQAALGGAALSPGNAGHSASSAINDLDFVFSAYAGTTYKKPYQYFGICKMASQIQPLGIGGLGGVNSNTAISSFDISNDSGGSFTAGIAEIWGIN